MSSNDPVVKVDGVGKCYQLYERPRDRLLQMVIPRLQRSFGQSAARFYREFWALQDVSFEARRGESIGIVGRNGSGKSTLLQIIAGTLTPTTGSVATRGRIAALLELGSGFNPDFTGRENAYLAGTLLGLTRSEMDARFDDVAAFADIGDFIDQPVKTYSSGMFVRLAFATQVQLDPDLLVVDEALAVGDSLFQKRCFERMEQLLSNGTTLLFVSHDQESIRTMTHRAILLRQGVVTMIGSPSDVLLAYRKQLHDEETAHLLQLAERGARRRSGAQADPIKQPAGDEQLDTLGAVATVTELTAVPTSIRAPDRSFGNLSAQVVGVEVRDGDGKTCAVFHPGDRVRIVVRCAARAAVSNVNVSLRIRNKEGVKMYSWGTLNQDMAILAGLQAGDIFWERRFGAGEQLLVAFDFLCTLGQNFYEVQAAISQEGKPYYAEQRMLHWVDEAAFFTVQAKQREYFFGGVMDLRMSCVALEA